MNRKQLILVVITLALITVLIASAVYVSYRKEEEDSGKIKITATFYPLAYFSQRIGGEHVSVDILVPPNSDIHSWQPSTSDIVSADESDILVFNGGDADHWFEDDVLPALQNRNKIKIVETIHGIEILEHDDQDGHEDEHEDEGNGTGDDHEEDEREEDDHHDHGDIDPHTWISPFLALQQAEHIYEALVEIDQENKEAYKSNWQKFKTELEDLDGDFKSELSNTTNEEIFVSHAAFGYLAHRYGFHQHGVIGLSADEQPSTSTIVSLADLMSDEGIYVIYVDPVYSDDYAQTIKTEVEKQTGEVVTILSLYLMTGPVDGKDYMAQQRTNLENLKTGLGV